MAMMENFQTQNDTALAQWVAGNKSFNVTGCFCFEQIKLSQSHPEATVSERTHEFAKNDGVYLYKMMT